MHIAQTVIAAACAALVSSTVLAQNRNTHVVPIAFAKGQRCWRYSGTAPEFRGTFRSGQSLTITATGDSHDSSPTGDIITTEARSISVLHGGSSVFESAGTRVDKFVVRQTGDYLFSINPSASWGYPQVFVICT